MTKLRDVGTVIAFRRNKMKTLLGLIVGIIVAAIIGILSAGGDSGKE